MTFHPSKGYNWKQSNADQQKKSPNTVLRAQEALALRHWMDRAIEVSAMKVAQSRQVIEQVEQEDVSKLNADIPAIRGKSAHTAIYI